MKRSNKTLQMRCRFRRWRRWSVGSSIVKTGWLDGVLGLRIGIFVERVRLALPALAVGGGMGVILRRWGCRCGKH